MDPNANLKEQLELARSILETFDNDDQSVPIDENDSARLAELVIALHEWITRGGFVPAAWQRKG